MSFTRFAIYYIPPEGPLASFGAAWLGWDVAAGRPVDQPDLPGLDHTTMTPRKYGFHGTLKPPFRLADGKTEGGLADAVSDMARALAPARADGLRLSRLGRFLALTPKGDQTEIARVAGTCVAALDAFRAAAPPEELARRRKAGLTRAQDALLLQWGYPYVMDEFRFHLTLTGRLAEDDVAQWEAIAARHLPDLPVPFSLDEIALVGERVDGRFELIQRYALTG